MILFQPMIVWESLAVASLVFVSSYWKLPSSLDGKIVQTTNSEKWFLVWDDGGNVYFLFFYLFCIWIHTFCGGVFSFTFLLQLQWPVESNFFTDLLFCAHYDWTHQVRHGLWQLPKVSGVFKGKVHVWLLETNIHLKTDLVTSIGEMLIV